jgi:hypothetical protein
MTDRKAGSDDDKRLVYDITEAGALLGLNKDAAYKAAGRGDFGQLIEIGRRKLVNKAAFHRKFDLPAA